MAMGEDFYSLLVNLIKLHTICKSVDVMSNPDVKFLIK